MADSTQQTLPLEQQDTPNPETEYDVELFAGGIAHDALPESAGALQSLTAECGASAAGPAAWSPESEASGTESGASAITIETICGDDAQVAALAERVMMAAPWVHYTLRGEYHTMTKAEVSPVIRRRMALGVDLLNARRPTSGGASTASTSR
ncbi:MAG: hypothetical protein PVH41_07410 [Anaerolineae bacterium]|jgi:hypothetical protein